jgi:hypothetical protein
VATAAIPVGSIVAGPRTTVKPPVPTCAGWPGAVSFCRGITRTRSGGRVLLPRLVPSDRVQEHRLPREPVLALAKLHEEPRAALPLGELLHR